MSTKAAAEFYHLRTITNQISSSNEATLPAQIPSLVALLYSSPILENAFSASSTREESTVLINRFKTRISSLLQSKTPQTRWAGVALAKASIESSQGCLGNYGKTWVPLVISLLGRPESPYTHALALATLCNVFNNLTINKPTLSREINSPNLKTFLDHIFNLLSSSSIRSSVSLDSKVPVACLQCVHQTLIAHAVTFRPYATKAHKVVLSILSLPLHSARPKVERLARQIFVNLHLCATPTKHGSSNSDKVNTSTAVSQEWTNALKAIIYEIHEILDVCLKAVKEQYSSDIHSVAGNNTDRDGGDSRMGLTSWKGLEQGIPRVTTLLRLLKTFLLQQTGVQVSVPVGMMFSLLTRCFNVMPPSEDKKTSSQRDGAGQINPAIGKHEREALWTYIVEIHETALLLLDTLIKRLRGLSTPLIINLLDQVIWVFENQSSSTSIRAASYSLLTTVLPLFGPALPKMLVHSLHPTLSKCCDDLLPVPASIVTPTASSTTSSPANPKAKGKNKNKVKYIQGADSFFPSQNTGVIGTQPTTPGQLKALISVAGRFLPHAVAYLPTSFIKSELRTKIDRTGILTQNRELILASVLYPPEYTKGSLLPFLMPHFGTVHSSRDLIEDLAVESLVWPRMPVIKTFGLVREKEDQPSESEEEEQEIEHSNPKLIQQPTHSVLAGKSPHSPLPLHVPAVPNSPSITPTVSNIQQLFLPTPSVVRGSAPRTLLEKKKEPAEEPAPKKQKIENSTETTSLLSTLANLSSPGLNPPPSNLSEWEERLQVVKGKEKDNGGNDDEMIIPEIDITMDTESESEDTGEGG